MRWKEKNTKSTTSHLLPSGATISLVKEQPGTRDMNEVPHSSQPGRKQNVNKHANSINEPLLMLFGQVSSVDAFATTQNIGWVCFGLHCMNWQRKPAVLYCVYISNLCGVMPPGWQFTWWFLWVAWYTWYTIVPSIYKIVQAITIISTFVIISSHIVLHGNPKDNCSMLMRSMSHFSLKKPSKKYYII